MLQVSSYSQGYNNYNNRSFSGASSVKAVPKVTSQATQTAKKAISLGAIFTALFGAKKVAEETPVVSKPSRASRANEYREERVYDKHGRLTNILKYSKADDVLSINVSYDTETGNVKQKDWYKKNGYSRQYTETYNNEGKKDKFYVYNNIGDVSMVEEYGKNQKIPKEATWFDRNGVMTEQVQLDEDTGNILNRFNFDEKANLVKRTEIAGLTGKPLRTTEFDKLGNKVIREFDIVSGKNTGTFKYDNKNNLVDFTVENKVYGDTVNLQKNKISNEDDFDCEEENKPNKNTNKLSDAERLKIELFCKQRFDLERSED